jgi:ketosteroid isomerase-like protein
VKFVVPPSIVTIALISGCATVAPSRPSASSQSVIEAKFAAVNRHALDEIVNLYSPEAQITASDFCQPRHGREDVRRTYKALFDAFPNIGVEVHEYVVQGDRVAVRVNIRNKPPGFAFDVPIMNFFTVRNGLIESDEGRFDNGRRRCSP